MSGQGYRILLIDDDEYMQLAVEMILKPLGYELTCCNTGSGGLEAMRRRRPHLVLLDIMLTYPAEGLEVACEMRQDRELKDVPLIFISAIGETFGMDYGREICPVKLIADRFVEKPLDAATLRGAVQDVLGRRYGSAGTVPARGSG